MLRKHRQLMFNAKLENTIMHNFTTTETQRRPNGQVAEQYVYLGIATTTISRSSYSHDVSRVRPSVAIYGQLLLFCDQSMRKKAWRSRKRGA